MKKITITIFLMIFSLGFSQNAPINFESGGYGASWTWTTFENPSTPAPPMVILANPFPSGINTSSKVAKLTPLVGSPSYAGVESIHGASIGNFSLSASNCTVKIMVYKSVISDVGIKFATSAGASFGEVKVANTVINQWELLTFDFSSQIQASNPFVYDQIIVFPDFQARTTDNVCYFDNITFSTQIAAPSGPTAAAPIPTRPSGNVISMFSNSYTNVAVDTWLTSWSAGSLTDMQIVGNDTKKYSNVNFVGVETVGANLINASTMTYFHVDAWTPNMTTFRIKLVDFGADAGYAGGDDKEHELSFTPTLSGWNSYDIAISDFTGLTTRSHIAQLIFSGNPSGSGTVYIDNVYFSNVALGIANFEKSKLKIYPNPASDILNIEANANIDNISVFNLLGQEVMCKFPKKQIETMDISKFESGVYIVKTNIEGVTSVSRIIKK